MVTLNDAEAARILGPRYAALVADVAFPKERKYHNQPVSIDGLHFDSKAEARRFEDLLRAQAAGIIRNVQHHVRYDLVVNGVDCGWYESDADYDLASGEHIVEDTKSPSTRTPVYRLKRKLMLACHGITISEYETEAR